MKTFNLLVVALMLAFNSTAADVLTEKLQRGLFEEEANHNLDAAIKEYQSVVSQSEEQRKVMATALFRLGECYRKLGKTNEAQAHYQRLLRDFSEQEQLTQLSRSVLGSNSVPATARPSVAEQMKRRETDEEAQSLARWREQIRENPDLVNKLELGPPLHQAVSRGWLSVVNFLLSQRADPNGRDNQQQTPLHIAVAVNRREIVEVLLQRGANVNARDNFNRTPLHVAASSGFLAIAQALIEAKADMNLLDQSRDTPLMIAVGRGYRAMTELLISRGAGVNKGSSSRQTITGTIYEKNPLSIAVTADNRELISLLVSNKADVDARGTWANFSGTPLVSYAAAQGFTETMKLLLDAGANPSQPTDNDQTALMIAAAAGRIEAAQLLLDRSANVNEANKDGFTALHFAAQSPSPEVVRLLLARGANVSAQTKNGMTPLLLAVQSNKGGAVKALLDAGAEPDVVANGVTPLSIAQGFAGPGYNTETRQTAAEIVQLLLARDANPFYQRQRTLMIGYRTNALAASFSRGTNDWNRYSLLELLAPSIGSYPWADWTNAYIERVVDRALTNLPVNLAALFASGQCSNDLWLEWGDRLLLPELDHPLNATAPPIPKSASAMFEQCLPRTVTIVVKGVTNELRLVSNSEHWSSLAPALPVRPGQPEAPKENNRPSLQSFRLLGVVYSSERLRASSDTSRVRVIRGTNTWVVNLGTIAFPIDAPGQGKVPPAHDLWLRVGDVIEVPDKQ